MFVPVEIIGAVAVLIVILLVLAFRPRRGGGEMIEQQRRATPSRAAAVAPPDTSGSAIPHNRPTDEAALLGIPGVREALQRGRKIEAIRHVREATGMGLKESKELVDRYSRRN